MGAQTAPGRGWDLAARRRPEEAQSGACAPPQGRPRRSPPISRRPSRPLPTIHTLTRMGGPTGPRRWPPDLGALEGGSARRRRPPGVKPRPPRTSVVPIDGLGPQPFTPGSTYVGRQLALPFGRVPGRPTPTGVRARDPGVKARPGGAPMGPGEHAGVLLTTPGPASGRPRSAVGPLFSPGFGRAGGRPAARPAAPGSEATATGHPTGTIGRPRAAALHSRVECRGRSLALPLWASQASIWSGGRPH